MSTKSHNETNRERFVDDVKPRRLKANKAKRHSHRQQLRDIDLNDLDSMDDYDYTDDDDLMPL